VKNLKEINYFIMFKRIVPIVPNPIYKLEPYELTNGDMDKILEFNNFNSTNLLFFMKENNHLVSTIIKFCPIGIIFELVAIYDFLSNYWSEELIDYLFSKCRTRFTIKYLSKQKCLDEFVLLNNMFNMNFNFVQQVFYKKYLELVGKIPIINLDDFYIGTNGGIYLGK